MIINTMTQPKKENKRWHLFIEQLLILSAITEENVGQLGPHILVLEVTDLRESEGG